MTYMETTRNTKDIPLAPVRGPIYDATGKVALAYSEPVQSLYVLLYEDYSNGSRQEEAQNSQMILRQCSRSLTLETRNSRMQQRS